MTQWREPQPKPKRPTASEKRAARLARVGKHYGGAEDWPALKAAVFTRDRYTCILCPRNGFAGHALECAHVMSVGMGGARTQTAHGALVSDERNLVTLCHDCHTQVDQGKNRTALRERITAYLEALYNMR